TRDFFYEAGLRDAPFGHQEIARTVKQPNRPYIKPSPRDERSDPAISQTPDAESARAHPATPRPALGLARTGLPRRIGPASLPSRLHRHDWRIGRRAY